MTCPAFPAHSFRESFLMTFKCFTTSEELVRLLEARFYIEPPSGLTEDEMRRWEMEKRMPIRLK
jgi:son of sevenless-like protein